MKFNGPYFNDPIETWNTFSNGYGKKLVADPMKKVIMFNNEIIGLVTAYWEDGPLKQWLEVGILLYQKKIGEKESVVKRSLYGYMTYLLNLNTYPILDLRHGPEIVECKKLAKNAG